MGAAQEDSPFVQPAAEAQRLSTWAHLCLVFLHFAMIFAVLYGFLCALYLLLDQAIGQVPHYSVAVDHVAGLDPGHGAPTLEPEFNLTLRVASPSRTCTRRSPTVRGVSLADTATLTQKICAGPMKGVEHHLAARGAGVVVPGSLLDGLAMDMRGGAPEFDVELHGPGPANRAWQCGPRVVGDAAALQIEC